MQSVSTKFRESFTKRCWYMPILRISAQFSVINSEKGRTFSSNIVIIVSVLRFSTGKIYILHVQRSIKPSIHCQFHIRTLLYLFLKKRLSSISIILASPISYKQLNFFWLTICCSIASLANFPNSQPYFYKFHSNSNIKERCNTGIFI